MRSKASILLLTLLICLFLYPMTRAAAAISAYEPDIPYGKWKIPATSQLFRIDSSTESNFIHTEDWYVEVDGKRVGKMMLMRPKTDGSKGLTFSHKNNLKRWGKAFGGNPAFVDSMTAPRNIESMYYSATYPRYYSRDIARWSGAHEPTIQGTGQYTQWGHQIGIVKIKTTPFPRPKIVGPSTVKKGEMATYTISGEEYSPHKDFIKWKFNEDSTLLDEGDKYNNKFSKTVKVKFDTCGTKKLKLSATDEVERESSVSKTVEVTGCDVPPTDGGDGGDGEGCNVPNIIGGDLRYEYELDLLVTKIEGETVERGTVTTTPVEVFRKDFSKNREKVKQEIQADINKTKQKIASLKSQLANLKSQLSNLQSSLATAQRGYSVTVCGSPDKDGNRDCWSETRYDYGLISNLQSQIAAKEKEIQKKECEIDTEEAKLKGFEKELADLEALEKKYEVVDTKTEVTFKGELKGSQTVSLKEGETKNLTYKWALPNDGSVRAEINPTKTYKEVTYANNHKATPIYIASHERADCSKPGGISKISGIVRTITTKDGTTTLKEYVEGKIVKQSRKSMRAGYGFGYEIETNYRNEDPKSNAFGIQKTESYFPTLVNYLPYKKGEDGYIVPMDLTQNNASNPPRIEKKVWSLPLVKVEEYSGNVFDLNYLKHPKHNPNEKVLNGGRKWYVPFDQKDGAYSFSVKGFDGGVNKLDICMTGVVDIKGSFTGDPNGNDDFIRRTASPNNPFPGGVGWNWKNKESYITDLQSWWNNPPNRDPKTVPSYFHESIIIDKNKFKQIKEYNQQHGMKFELNDQFEKAVGY